MVGPRVKRKALELMKEVHGLSTRRACRLLKLWQSTVYYRKKRNRDDESVKKKMSELAQSKPRYGRPRIIWLMRREGFLDNHKRLGRIYRELGLQVRKRPGKRKRSGIRLVLPAPSQPNELWSMDFMSDSLHSGRKIRLLTIVDDFTREAPAIEVDLSLTGERVAQVLDRLKLSRGLPKAIICDNGPEFISKALSLWSMQNNVDLKFIQPGKPVQNAYIESFNGKVRDECLNQNWFLNLEDAKFEIERWRKEYNSERPHSALKTTPELFAQKHLSMLSA